MEKEIVYSIIIPHKDIPQLLQRCLDSIPEREDVQVIVVDDNSSPEVVDFSSFPGCDRPDVEVFFTKEGKGAGYARNCGLEYARGKWILFADADDFFRQGFLDVLDGYAYKDYDMVIFRADSVDSDTLLPVSPRQGCYADLSENADLDKLKFSNVVPWGKLISHQLIQKYHIRFDETPAANDVLFSGYLDYHAQKVAASSGVIYCATLRKGSLEYGAVLGNLLARVDVACRYNRFLYRIGRKDKLLYSYFRVKQCEKFFGRRGYYKALWIYIRKERVGNIYKTFRDLITDKIRRLFKL